FQEGLRVPPVRLRRAGERQDDIYQIILGASRLAASLEMDLTAMTAANEVAHRRIRELHARYGVDTVLMAMSRSLDHSETAVRSALSTLPDGVFTHTDFLDHDGHSNEIYHITCVLTKKGEQLTFDLSQSSPQAPGFINSTQPATLGAIISGVFPLLGANAPSWNSGILRTIAVKTEPGTIVHPLPPAPVSASSVAAAWTASHTVVAALSKLAACGEDLRDEATATSDGCWPLLNLFGLDTRGEPFGDMFLDPVAWGGGAYLHRDGIDAGGAFVGPTAHILDVETKENAVPVLYMWRRQRRDTGGPGMHRGGVTSEFAITPHGVDAIQATLATHGIAQPNCAGLFGGLPGATAGYECVTNTALYERLSDGFVNESVDAIP
ncbi:hydantoinase B/oxoprolinase family protein, partial [Streptomyces sp. NPDC059083]|uniref:hydantoinase B/oxoprolinase family protein n=1 Tax=Streptomyces sp. NPDC059083 TaxID=3346721 RepID=UPI00367A4D92